MHRNIKVIFYFFFQLNKKTPRKANTSYYDDAENTRFLYMGLCTRVLYTIQHLSNDYSSWIETGNLIFGTLLHNYLTKSISFSANKYLSKLHTLNDNGLFFSSPFFTEYPINRLVIRFANHFNLFKLVWHFKWLNLANHPVNANSQMLRPTICCLTIF